MPKILVTRPIPPFCDEAGSPINLITGTFAQVNGVYAKIIQKKRYGVICTNKCLMCPYPGFMAAKGREDCDGCMCELRSDARNRQLDEFV